MRIAALALSLALLTQPTQASDCPVATADIKREFRANRVINLELAEAPDTCLARSPAAP